MVIYQNQDWLPELVKIWEENQKNWDSYQVLVIVVAEIVGRDLGCGRKLVVFL